MLYLWNIDEPDGDRVHRLIRHNFQGPVASFVEDQQLYVLADETPKQVPTESYDMILPENIQSLDLVTRVSFSNAYRIHNRRNFYKDYTDQQALEKFCQNSGLEAVRSSVIHQGTLQTRKFFSKNTFMIQGEFTVRDQKRLRTALRQGVGGEKSYGYGLIIIRDYQE